MQEQWKVTFQHICNNFIETQFFHLSQQILNSYHQKLDLIAMLLQIQKKLILKISLIWMLNGLSIVTTFLLNTLSKISQQQKTKILQALLHLSLVESHSTSPLKLLSSRKTQAETFTQTNQVILIKCKQNYRMHSIKGSFLILLLAKFTILMANHLQLLEE